jgi:nitrate/nitrite-specific signal transduction histidine kinase
MTEIRGYLDIGRASLAAETRWEDTLTGVLRSLSADGGPTLSIELSTPAAARVAMPDRGDIVFIAREAVSNAVRHGQAKRIAVQLSLEGQGVRLEIEDDGHGFINDGPLPGLGLLTMTRRAGRMGAVLTIHSTPGRGTKVQLDVAVRKELAP